MKKKLGYLSKETLNLLAMKAEEQVPSLDRGDDKGEEQLWEICGELRDLIEGRAEKVSEMTYNWVFDELDWMYVYGCEKLKEEAKGV